VVKDQGLLLLGRTTGEQAKMYF